MTKSKKKNKYDVNNINDFTKKGLFESLFSNMYIFDYKFIIYWLPVILYIIFISLYIVGFNDDNEFSVAFISVFRFRLLSTIMVWYKCVPLFIASRCLHTVMRT